MSISKDYTQTSEQPIMPSGWTSLGTARSKFAEQFADDTLKNQLALPVLSDSLLKLKQQFSEIQIGSEYFFQVFDFLHWAEGSSTKDNETENMRFHVLLTGILLMRKATNSGSTCLPWTELQSQISTMLTNSGFSGKKYSQENWKNWLLSFCKTREEDEELSAGNSIFTENNSLLYFNKFWKCECRLMSLLKNRLKMLPDIIEKSVVENAIRTVLEVHPVLFMDQPLKLSKEQNDAVQQAILSPFLIITGSPGTGKTSVALTILRVLKRLGLAEQPALAAPTGRAANRLSESVVNGLNSIKDLSNLRHDQDLLKFAADAKTLHRLLGYHPVRNSFRHHEYDPLEHDLLIIDEGSMIDQELLLRLLRASNSELPYQLPVQRIVILGDSHQLPSVGSGAVMMELTLESSQASPDVTENPVHVVRLVKNYRQEISNPAGKNILGVAVTVRGMGSDPRPQLLFEAESPNHQVIQKLKSLDEVKLEKITFLNQENSFDQLKDFGKWWFDKFLKDENFNNLVQREYSFENPVSLENDLNYLFNYLKRFRILTATQVFSTGARALNIIIRDFWVSENGVHNLNSEHFPGEPVIVTENNYQLSLFNGDQGIFLKCLNPETKKLELKAVFEIEGAYRTFYGHQLHHLQRGYAITVHKSQGSEFDYLALILPDMSIDHEIGEPDTPSVQNLISREMLYTALTRAKKSVLILGRQSALETAALQKERRYSGLGDLIRSNKE